MANLGNLALTAGNRVRTILDTAERTALALLVQTLRRRGPLSPFLRRRMLRILQRGLIQARTEALRQYRQAYDAAARELETLAAEIGRDAAALRDALPPKLPEPSVDASAILRHMRRDVDDLFRDIQEAAVAHREETGATVGAAMQEVLDAFAESGITSFTDAGGRRWGLQEYANMVVRTGVQRAGLQATVDRMLANGWDLCFVTPHMGCCPQCAAWQGVVMSLTGKTAGYPTVQQAMDGGLFHPNCAHVLQVYIPGVSDLTLGIPKGFTRDSNAKLYTARQRQRFIERKIRQAKREQAAAFTPEAEQAAREELRRWQAAARANAQGEVQRRYDREKVLTGRIKNGIMASDSWDVWHPITDESITAVPEFTEFGTPEMNKAVHDACVDILTDMKNHEIGTEKAISIPLSGAATRSNTGGEGEGTVQIVMLGEPFIAVHNHASNETHSYRDISFFANQGYCVGAVVIGNNGKSVYMLMKTDQFNDRGFTEYRVQQKQHPEKFASEEDFLKGVGNYGIRYVKRNG